MARTEARIRCAIWDDEDYCSLPFEAQWLYKAILSQKDLSLCGVVIWTAKRFAKLAPNLSANTVKKSLALLIERRYVVLDDDTDELGVRTFLRNDRVIDSPNLILAMSHDFGAIRSRVIRRLILEQLGEGFMEGLPQRFPKGLPKGFYERLGEGFMEALGSYVRAGAHVPPAPGPSPQLAPAVAGTTNGSKPRPPDPLWDEAAAVLGHKPGTERERGAWNGALKQLRDAGATPADLRLRSDEHRRRWPNVSLTLPSLVKHWGALGAREPARTADSWLQQ